MSDDVKVEYAAAAAASTRGGVDLAADPQTVWDTITD
jgi:hypothetical protein